MFKNYIIIATRNLLRQKAYSVINIAGLATGMACTILILLWVQDELSFDQFHENKNEIHRVIFDYESGLSSGTCGALAPALKDEIPEIKNYVRMWVGGNWQIYYGDKNVRERSLYADPSIFEVFSFPLIEGNPQTALSEPHSVVLTETLANKLFGEEEPVGKMLHINNRFGAKETFHVTGVTQNIPKNSHLQFDFLFSFNLLKEWYRPDFGEAWTNHSFAAYVLVQKNSSIPAVNQKITDCYNRHKQGTPQKLKLQTLSQVYLNPDVKYDLGGPRGNIDYINIFIIIALFILLIACINFMNLATARSAKRAKEVGLRKVAGAGKVQIMSQYFGESLLIAFAALPIALILIELSRQPFNNLTGKNIALDYFDPAFIACALIIVIFTGIVSGSYPALYVSSFKPAEILKGSLISGGQGSLFRKILVVFQFSLSIFIIVATLVVSNQMDYILSKDLGFNKENLIYTLTPGFQNDAIRNEMLKNPNIVNVGASGFQQLELNFTAWSQGIQDWQGRGERETFSIGLLEVGYNYLDTYGMKMAQGRYYSREYGTDSTDAIIVNEAAVKAMNIDSPIGKTFNLFGSNQRIIGVVKDFHFTSLHSEIGPIAFVLYPGQLRCLGIRVKPENVATTLNYIKDVLARLVPDYVLEYHFLDEQLDRLYSAELRRGKIVGYFSLISIFISCLGLFGLAAFTAEQRTKEIGIRRVLGASISGIVALLSNSFVKWILIANIIAFPIAWFAMNKWLQNFTYHIDIGWWTFVLAGWIALVIGLLTVSLQAIRAATANPVKALRYE